MHLIREEEPEPASIVFELQWHLNVEGATLVPLAVVQTGGRVGAGANIIVGHVWLRKSIDQMRPQIDGDDPRRPHKRGTVGPSERLGDDVLPDTHSAEIHIVRQDY
jgi:hypothetical protein